MEDKDSNKVWTVKLEEDGDDLIMPIPQEILDHLDIQEGDMLQWNDNGNGTISLTKVQYDSDSGVEGKL